MPPSASAHSSAGNCHNTVCTRQAGHGASLLSRLGMAHRRCPGEITEHTSHSCDQRTPRFPIPRIARRASHNSQHVCCMHALSSGRATDARRCMGSPQPQCLTSARRAAAHTPDAAGWALTVDAQGLVYREEAQVGDHGCLRDNSTDQGLAACSSRSPAPGRACACSLPLATAPQLTAPAPLLPFSALYLWFSTRSTIFDGR